jgi:hypothetical protein
MWTSRVTSLTVAALLAPLFTAVPAKALSVCPFRHTSAAAAEDGAGSRRARV